MSKEKDAEAFKELCEITALLNKNAQRNAVTSQKYSSVTSPHNAVTVPADKLAELQRKAKLVDELVKELSFLRDVMNNNGYATTHTDSVIAKAKGE